MSITVENLSYVYLPDTPMQKQALFDVSVHIDDKEFVGIIGHTGSGKSTLIQHFNGLVKPTSGRVLVDGVDLTQKGVNLRAIRRKVGMVFQYPEHQLFGETVFEDVAFGPKNSGVPDAALEDRVREGLAMVDLDLDVLRERSPFELSGGQKRRVAIAGVLAMKPAILILDEPTAGLDPRGRDEILSQVQSLYQAWDLTVILVTHSMEDIARMAKRLIVMDHGRIALDGTPQDVFSNADKLRSMGLGVPQVTTLIHELHRRGLVQRRDIFTLDEAESEITRVLELKRHGNA